MRIQISQEEVRFGTVQHVGKRAVIITLADGGKEQTRRLLFSHFRRAGAECGGVVFGEGRTQIVQMGNEVAYVPRDDDFCLWALRDEYDTAVSADSQMSTPAP